MFPREEIEPLELRATVDSFASLWGLIPDRLSFVRNFNNLVYRHDDGTDATFLRLTTSHHRTCDQVMSELEFVVHLNAMGVSVAAPIASSNTRLVESLTICEKLFSAVLFREAAGEDFQKVATRASLPQDFFRDAGRSLGELHEAGRSFVPSPNFIRFGWYDDHWCEFEQYVPKAERGAWRLFEELREWLSGQSADAPYFGMIHGDFTILNMRFTPNRITLFDFDSCCNHWYAYEIAIFLHYFGGQSREERRRIYDSLLAGYAERSELPQQMIDQIPTFAKMRLLYSFLRYAEEWGFTGLSEQQEGYFALRRRLFAAEAAWPP